MKEIEKAKEISVIVEGKNDALALKEIGFKRVIILHREGVPIYSVIDEIKEKECVILTDIDRKGGEYSKLLRSELLLRGIRINDSLRREMAREKISHVEGLATFMKNHALL